jgi:NAD(P)-dependent dehydrogenase (short-subunit alcohol dehydrogenase family)
MTTIEPGVAVVTGAGSGIGQASAVALARAGWRLVLAGRRPEALEETARLIGEETLRLPTDVGRPEAVAALFAAVEARFGRLDLLFNNAGVFPRGALIDEVPDAAWDEAVAVNLSGAFYCARAAFGLMRRQTPGGGRIINNGSISAHVPRPRSTLYSVTKHAVSGLTKCLSLDGRDFGIVCGQIDIGNAATPLTCGVAKGALQADGSVRPEAMMDVAHAAEAVAFMASLPLEANVQFMTVAAAKMPFIGRG